MAKKYKKEKYIVDDGGEIEDESNESEYEDAEDSNMEEDEDSNKEKSKKSDFIKLANEATKVACRQLVEGLKSRAGRFDEIAKNEAQYYGEKTRALKGRSNIPFDSVIARGYVDTLHSKIDESLEIEFQRAPGRQQDKKSAQKISAVCQYERGPDMGAWDMKDLGVKKLAIFSGRGIYKKFSSKVNGEFRDHLEVVDHWDFVTEKNGGGFLDAHRYKGQINILKTKSNILDKVNDQTYNKKQAYKMFHACSTDSYKANEQLQAYKINRAASLGLDYEETKEAGSQLYHLVEWVMNFRGNWYYIVFNYDTKIWLRFEKLEDVFSVASKKPGRGPWVSWATHFDPVIFWSISPMDSVRPIASAIKKVMNYSLDNLEKRNWGQRAYDPNVFNPRDLMWKDDGLVKASLRNGQSLGNHIMTFETPDTTSITVNLTEYLDNFLGRKTGITQDAQGKSEQQKVGIYMGDMQAVADRLGLTNKMYEQAHIDIGLNFQHGLLDHMSEKYAVKVIGNSGIEWNEELQRNEVKNNFTIRVRGTNTEEKLNAVLAQRKEKALAMVTQNQALATKVNPTWLIREILTLGGYDSEEIRVGLDTNSDADDDILSEAAQAIEDIITGKKPKQNRGATTGYIRKIVEFAYDTELSKEVFDRLVAFATLHIPIAQENAARKLSKLIANAGSDAIAGAKEMIANNETVPEGAQLPPDMQVTT